MKERNFISRFISSLRKQTAEQDMPSGMCGDKASWNVDLETGELRIKGEGAIYDFYGSVHQPWNNLLEQIKHIVIENGITTIGFQAFRYCDKLSTVSIPESVTKIKGYAFAYCNSLTDISLPSGLEKINNNTFTCCFSLKHLTFPPNITYVGKSAFEGCEQLESIILPNRIKGLDKLAFSQCDKLSKIHLPESLTHIGDSAFANCFSLEHIEIPSCVTFIGNEAFANCRNLTHIKIPSSVRGIGEHIFSGCNKLTELSLPFPGSGMVNSYHNFGKLFSCMPQTNMVAISQKTVNEENETCYIPATLTHLIINEGCEIISEYCLYNCKTLKTITFPASLYLLEKEALWGCAGLQEIKCNGTIPAISHENTFTGIRKSLCKITVPHNTEDVYRKEEGWKEFQCIATK